MNTLKEIIVKFTGIPESQIASDVIYCHKVDKADSLRTNNLRELLDGFAFSIILKGKLRLLHNGKEVEVLEKDLYIYSPGLPLRILEVSDDFSAIRMAVDKRIMFEHTFSHNLIKAAFFPVVHFDKPKLTLPDETFIRLREIMKAIIFHLNSDIIMKSEACQQLFSLFLIDLVDFLEKSGQYNRYSQKAEKLVLEFIRLADKNFKQRHDVSFYARQLHISPIYLSRIVKRQTGKTVINHLDGLLASEAVWMLKSTEKSIKEIAEALNFSDQASFSKFFLRMKGTSPTAFRQETLLP